MEILNSKCNCRNADREEKVGVNKTQHGTEVSSCVQYWEEKIQ